MAFLANLSDSDEDNSHQGSLFNHSERNFAAIIREQARNGSAAKIKKKDKAPFSAPLPRKTDRKRKSEVVDVEDKGPDNLTNSNATRSGTSDSVALRKVVLTQELKAHSRSTSSTSTDANQKVVCPAPAQSSVHVAVSDDEEPPIFQAGEAVIEDLDEENSEESDDEFVEIARRARIAQRQKIEASQAAAAHQSPTSAGHVQPVADPKIEIFLSSEIPGTSPLRVFVRLSQPLGAVRNAWVSRQVHLPGTADKVYLTYRGRRVFDRSTSRSLGLEVNAEGELYLKGAEDKLGIDKVHLEAVIDYAQEQPITDHSELHNAVPSTSNSPLEDHAPQDPVIRVVLRAPKFPDYKLKVRPSTTIARIISGYKRVNKLNDGQHVTLSFDGEELLPDQLVSETEISDLDILEMHIK